MYPECQWMAQVFRELTLHLKVGESSLTMGSEPFWSSMAQKIKVNVPVAVSHESAYSSGCKSADF